MTKAQSYGEISPSVVSEGLEKFISLKLNKENEHPNNRGSLAGKFR